MVQETSKKSEASMTGTYMAWVAFWILTTLTVGAIIVDAIRAVI